MKIRLSSRSEYAVLLPSAGRAVVLAETLRRQPFLNRPSTFVGIQQDQLKTYRRVVLKEFDRVTPVVFDNPGGATVVARENLRRHAIGVGFKRYVCVDDNTMFLEESLENLVRASFIYRPHPVVVGGLQGGLTADTKPSRFDEAYVKKSGHEYGGLRFYKKIGMMFWVFPHELYKRGFYLPEGWWNSPNHPSISTAGCMEDHSMALSLMKHCGFTNFVVCMDAPFKKKRFQPGGQGDPVARARKIGMAWMRLGELYPEFMSEVRMVWPYAKFYKKTEKEKER